MNKLKTLFAGAVAALALALALGFDSNNAPVSNTLPATSLIAVTPSDSVDLPVVDRGLYVGGAGNLVLIGQGDGATLNGASTANAATLTVTTAGVGNPAAYSSTTPGQYIICGDGTHAAEIISGYLVGTTLTVTTGGGTGGNTTLNAHNSGTLVGAYAPLNSVNAGSMLPIRARRVMNTNTTATNIVEVF